MLDVHLLGPVRLLRDGDEVDLGGAKQRAVLALLALEAPRAVSLESIIDGIWGEEPPASARNAVQVYVSGLRKALGDAGARIDRNGEAYRLIGAEVRIDLAAFTERVAEGRSALRAGAYDRAADLLGEALATWDGAPLGGLENLPLHTESAQVVLDQRATARTELVDALLGARRLPDAVTQAHAAVRENPLDEHAWAQLASAQYHSGAQADSLTTLRKLRSMLSRELGVDPSPEVAAVEAAIRNQTLAAPWPDQQPTRAADAPQSTLPAAPALVIGRDEVIDRVVAALAPGRIVTIVGLGGMGKTTVALAVAHRLAQTQAVHFCELHTETTALGAFERLCRQLGIEPDDDPGEALATAAPTGVLVLDNAEQVEGLGAALATVLRSAPLTVLVTSRVPLRTRDEQVVRLEPLSITAPEGETSPAAQLFLARCGHPADVGSAATAQKLGELLDGVPLAIELVAARTRALTADQLLQRLGRKGVDGTAGRPADLPDRQRSQAAVIESTLETLSAGAATLVDQLGSIGGWVTTEFVEQVFDDARAGSDDDADFVDALEDIVDLGLAQLDDGRVRLRQPVLDHVVHRVGDRREVDDRVDRNAEQLVARAAPVLRGPEAAGAVERLGRDHDTIVAALARGIETGAAQRVRKIVLGLDRYWMLTGRLVEGRRWLEAARGLEHGPVGSIEIDLLLGTYLGYLGDVEAIPLLDKAIGDADRVGVPIGRLLVNAACNLSATHARVGDREAARSSAARAARLAAESGDEQLVALARDLVGFVASYCGDHQLALDSTLAGLKDARRSGDRFDLVLLLGAAAECLVELNRGQEALDLTDEAFELSRGLDVGPVIAHVLVMRGLALTRVEQVAEARGCLLEALRMSRQGYPDPLMVGSILTVLAAGSALAGDDLVAAKLWGAGDAYFEDSGGTAPGTQGYLGTVLAFLRDRLGEQRTDTLRMAGGASPDDLIERLLVQV